MSMSIDIVRQAAMAPEERRQMYSVFSRYYENVSSARFESDLDAKDWVIQLRNDSGSVVGFSTLQTYRHTGLSGPAIILYSGDTIVDRPYRTNGDLAGAFGHLLVRAIDQDSRVPIFWLLTSKGVRTYRFLPVFFKTFFPGFDRSTPDQIKRLIDDIATKKFGSDYSPASQVVSHNGQRDWLCAAEHDPLLMKRSDPHIAFFLESNPEYAKGDELVCLTEVCRANLNSRAWRVIKHTEVNWRE
jgi:hypothetical protein